MKARVTGNNTGIQYRSQELTDVGRWSIGGYQCDIHPAAPNNAMLYHERGRGIVAQNGQTILVDPQGDKFLTAARDPVAVNTEEFHEYAVTAVGNHLVHKLDGKLTAEIFDYDPKGQSFEGLLAIQVHRGPAMRVQVKEVLLKVLPDAPVAQFDAAKLPADAKKLEKPAPKKAPAKNKNAPKKAAANGPRSNNRAAVKAAPAALANAPAKPRNAHRRAEEQRSPQEQRRGQASHKATGGQACSEAKA
ncbi:MAG: DUF1080 domain-containing protein [Pirellulales bacterium]